MFRWQQKKKLEDTRGYKLEGLGKVYLKGSVKTLSIFVYKSKNDEISITGGLLLIQYWVGQKVRFVFP